MRFKRGRVKCNKKRWVSNNRVLVGSAKSDPGRNPNFDAEETKLLISLWGDPVVQKTLITSYRKQSILSRLAEKMREHGYRRSTDEISTRLKNLKCFYKRMKKDIEMGTISEPNWRHFQEMDEIMSRSTYHESCEYSSSTVSKSHSGVERKVFDKEQHATKTFSNADYQTHSRQLECFDVLTENYNRGDCNSEDVNRIQIKAESDDIISTNQDVTAPTFPDYTPTTIPHQSIVDSNCNSTIQPTLTSALKTAVNAPILIANQKNFMTTAGKISLVPTNFLLQPNTSQRPQIQIRPQAPSRLIYSQPTSQATTSLVGPAGAGRMKVLLVNTLQNGKTNLTTGEENTFTSPNILTTGNILTTKVIDSAASKPSTENTSRTEENGYNRNAGMEMLVNQLIHLQEENNKIQRQHLEVEKQRLEFEKSISEKILQALMTFGRPEPTESTTIAGSGIEQPVDNGQQKEMNTDFNGFTLLTPKVEMDSDD